MEDEILTLLANRRRMMTYHIANSLRLDHPKHNGTLATSTVLRCLKRMEKAGRVERVRSPYAVQICWAMKPAGSCRSALNLRRLNMDDRELLDLAARANNSPNIKQKNFGAWFDEEREQYWNPLSDDGAALRLAVVLRLTVSWDRFDDDDYATATPPHTHQGWDCIVDQDPTAATRRAIVRAAAEIGRSMPQTSDSKPFTPGD